MKDFLMKTTMHFNASTALAGVVLVLLALASCRSETRTNSAGDVGELQREVLEVHDEVMPKMSDISTLRSQLKSHLQSDSLDQDEISRIDEAILALNEADEAMMTWMHDYSDNKPPGDTVPDVLRSFLEKEMEKIQAVRDKMLESISNAKSLLKELERHEK